VFNDVLEQNANNAACNFYSGVAYQETGQFDKAITSYQEVVKDKNNLFIEQAEWYIGLCYLQTENRKKAYKQFKRIADSDSYYQEKANAVIRKIKYFE
jgi:tetratricopeptide (TPR) repeat protein